jgi:hypothetical protein
MKRSTARGFLAAALGAFGGAFGGLWLAQAHAAAPLQVEVRKPVVNPGGIILACSMEFAAVLRQLAERMPAQAGASYTLEIISWDERCRTTDFEFKTANGATVRVDVKSAAFGKPASRKKYLIVAEESVPLEAVCKTLAKQTASSCVLLRKPGPVVTPP